MHSVGPEYTIQASSQLCLGCQERLRTLHTSLNTLHVLKCELDQIPISTSYVSQFFAAIPLPSPTPRSIFPLGGDKTFNILLPMH